MSTPFSQPNPGLASASAPTLLFVQGNEQQTIRLDQTPFTIGRKAGNHLVMTDPRVSREHASIVAEDGQFCLVDGGSNRTFVNGACVQRQTLKPNDRLEFGARDAAYVIFNPQAKEKTNTTREFLTQIQDIHLSSTTTDLEKLTMFLEAARRLNTSGVLEEILVTLLDTTLKLTRAERAYVFLKGEEGQLRLAAGRSAKGEPLLDEKTISHSILEDALQSNSEFLITDTVKSLEHAERRSVVAFDLRMVICIPLRKPQVQAGPDADSSLAAGEVMGALYVDSRFASRNLSEVSNDILRAIATEAAALIENARLVQAENAARRYQQELSIAARIQQGLMAVTIPEVPFARLRGKNLSCKEIGGDFFDVVNTEKGLAVVLADVSGKGVSAALLASTLQGMIYSQLTAGMELTDIVTAVNRFFTHKNIREKYATMVVARVRPDGHLEYVNCGHVAPLLVCGREVIRPSHGNLPVGLVEDVTYESDHFELHAGDRLVLVTDGVTEAENASGDFFDNERLEAVAAKSEKLDDIFAAIAEFCAGAPLNDDCTVVEVQYTG